MRKWSPFGLLQATDADFGPHSGGFGLPLNALGLILVAKGRPKGSRFGVTFGSFGGLCPSTGFIAETATDHAPAWCFRKPLVINTRSKSSLQKT